MDAFLVSTGIVGLAEIGDKTQLLAFLLAARFRRPLPIVFGILVARYESMAAVAAGTTLGMMLANVPAVVFGERIANRAPLMLVHGLATLLFAVLGIATLLGAGEALGF